MDYETVIGLETHVQLKTETKLFCACSTRFGSEPNSQVCPVCMGLPGSLPVLNRQAFEMALLAGLAFHCEILRMTKFDRKNYFYPDLPKGYQISQYDLPFSRNGHLDVEVDGRHRRMRIHRIHLEEDAGKLVHPEIREIGEDEEPGRAVRRAEYSLVDFNRCGVPLLEIVTEPDLRTPEEAYEYLTRLKVILQYLGVSDCDMEKGSLRCDANVSVRPMGETSLGVKVEVKNLNSFKFLANALRYEAKRQIDLLGSGGRVVQETRLWDQQADVTRLMRSKEEAHDYRYFPEPDLAPVVVADQWIEEVRRRLPELPEARRARFQSEYTLPEYDAEVLTRERALADFFEEAVRAGGNPKTISNWIMVDILRQLREQNLKAGKQLLKPSDLVDLVAVVESGRITRAVAREILAKALSTGESPRELLEAKSGAVEQIHDEAELRRIARAVLEKNPKAVADYRGGKPTALKAFIGQMMRETRGKANPQLATQILEEELGKL